MKKDIYKEFYQFEWDHRSHLTSALNMPISGATVIGGGLAVMVQGFTYSWVPISIIFVCLATLSALCLLIVLFFIFKSFLGYHYNRIATPLTFKKYYDDLLEWHVEYKDGEASAIIRFEEYYNQRLAEAAEVNAHNNKNRSAYLLRANVTLAISLCFLVFSAVPYLVVKISEPNKIHHIKVVKPISIVGEENTMPDDESDNEQTIPEPPPEPMPPRNEEIKEYSVDKELNSSTPSADDD